jgi:transcriptional antiterminator NusG
MLMTTFTKAEIEARRNLAQQKADERERQRTAPGEKWYIAQRLRGTDSMALSAFDRYRIGTYYPKIVSLKPLPRKRMSQAQRAAGFPVMAPTEVALFPGYIFAHFDIRTSEWRNAFEVAGVGGLICKDGMPVWLPDDLIASIKRRENNGVVPGKESTRAVFGIGEHVTVTNGPFASFPGIVEKGFDIPIEDLEPRMRIKVAVNVFGRATPVELEYWQVAKQDDQQPPS